MWVKAPPPPVWSWTGFYLDGNFGYSWGTSNSTVSFLDSTTGALLAAPNASFSMDGFFGGGGAGYNWQTGNWVWGLEADIQYADQQGSATFACGAACGAIPVSETLNERLDWFGTVRGRLGFTVTPTVLLYATGGLAYGDVASSGAISDPTSFSTSTLKTGWTVGGGLESRIVGNWTAKIEYLYMNLGSVAGTASDPTYDYIAPVCGTAAPIVCTAGHTLSTGFNSGITDNILRLGVNYKFN
jgi:outer membrane immunogenic protein